MVKQFVGGAAICFEGPRADAIKKGEEAAIEFGHTAFDLFPDWILEAGTGRDPLPYCNAMFLNYCFSKKYDHRMDN